MSKTRSVQGARRRRADSPAERRARDTRRVLDRILDTPHLAQVVPRLSPEVLHRVIQSCGLEDCGELVALATPAQLARVFDFDLWCPVRAGLDEELDADRSGIWLEILMESGAIVAAQKLAGMEVELVVAALAKHVLVFDRAAVSPSTVDGQEMQWWIVQVGAISGRFEGAGEYHATEGDVLYASPMTWHQMGAEAPSGPSVRLAMGGYPLINMANTEVQ